MREMQVLAYNSFKLQIRSRRGKNLATGGKNGGDGGDAAPTRSELNNVKNSMSVTAVDNN